MSSFIPVHLIKQKIDKKYIHYINNSYTCNLTYLAKKVKENNLPRYLTELSFINKTFNKCLILGPILDSAYFGERSFGLGAEIQVFNSPWWTKRKNGQTQARTGLGICYLQGKGKSFTTAVSFRCDLFWINNENTT